MCLLTKEFPFINKENITCYKVVKYIKDKYVCSLYYNYLYILNKPYGNQNYTRLDDYDIKISKDLVFYIQNDFYHAYNELEFAKEKLKESKRYFKNGDELVIVKCIIPKYSLCFKNEFEICSTNIIIDDVLIDD